MATNTVPQEAEGYRGSESQIITDQGKPGSKIPWKTRKEATRQVPAGKIFADPIQYGVAVVNGNLVIRSGAVVYCIRQKK